MHADPKDDQVLYLSGRLQGAGSVIRFQKRDATVRWWAKFKLLSNIYAFAQGPTDGNLFVCGDYQPNEAATSSVPDTAPYETSEFQAGFARMTNDGEVRWFKMFTGTNPQESAANGIYNQDRCRGISYDEENDILSVIIQTKAQEVRDEHKGDHYDTVLILLDRAGNPEEAVAIGQGSLAYDMYSASQALFHRDGQYYFTGWSYGFQTSYQTLEADATNPKYDAYVYRYEFGRDSYTCLRRRELSASEVNRRLSDYGADEAVDLRKRGSQLFTQIVRKDYFFPYLSRYSGGFVLIDTFRIPRPCAYRSQNMTAVDYYRGQKTYTYDIYNENAANSVTLMTDDATIQYQTGEPAYNFDNPTDINNLAQLDLDKNTVLIQTDSEDMVGVQKVLIRDCDALNRLLEANLYVEVLSNNYPDFVTEPTTSWTMAVDDVVTYRLPNVVDPEANDEPEVYVGIMDA